MPPLMRFYLLFIIVYLDRWLSPMQNLLCQVLIFCRHVLYFGEPTCLHSSTYQRLRYNCQVLVIFSHDIGHARYHPTQLAPQVRTYDQSSSCSIYSNNKLNLTKQTLGSTSHSSEFSFCCKFYSSNVSCTLSSIIC